MNILITGGTKGIGRATALKFASNGARLFLNYSSDETAAERTREDVVMMGGEVHLLKYDMGESDHIIQMGKQIRSITDQLDVIVHCAAGIIRGDALDISPVDWSRAVEVSSLSLVHTVRECRPMLKEGSSIIALSSRGATNAVPQYAALGATKAFTESLIRYLAIELAPYGIRANVVAAGPLDTEAFRTMFPGNAQDRLDAAARANPSGRGLTFDDVTETIVFLSSPAAQMIQGQVIFVDGGLYVK